MKNLCSNLLYITQYLHIKISSNHFLISVEFGRAVDQLDQISYSSDTPQQLDVQAQPQGQPRLIKETTSEEEESWTQVSIAAF